nr:hypothetical protein [Rhizobium leguminosarum]
MLDFVSTTCGPCGRALARLGSLQKKYSDIEVEVIGVAANEKAATADEARAQVDAWLTTWLPHSKIRVAFDHSYPGRGLQKILGSPVGTSKANVPSFSVSKPYVGSPSGLAHGQQWTRRGLDGGIVSACQRIKAFVLMTAASFRLSVLALMWIKEKFVAS